MKPILIVSGGQTGADLGGLRAAKKLGILTGGYAPSGYRTEKGANWDLRREFNLVEDESYEYEPRTRKNVQNSNATIIFGRRSVGSILTETICRELEKPCWWVWLHPKSSHLIATHSLKLWLLRAEPEVLNVAGNRESVFPGIGKLTEEILLEVLGQL